MWTTTDTPYEACKLEARAGLFFPRDAQLFPSLFHAAEPISAALLRKHKGSPELRGWSYFQKGMSTGAGWCSCAAACRAHSIFSMAVHGAPASCATGTALRALKGSAGHA